MYLILIIDAMNTHSSRTTQESRDSFVNLEREFKIHGFSRKTIRSYLYCNKEFIEFASKSFREIKIIWI